MRESIIMLILMSIGIMLTTIIVISEVGKSERRNELIAQCMQDHKEYECEAMFR